MHGILDTAAPLLPPVPLEMIDLRSTSRDAPRRRRRSQQQHSSARWSDLRRLEHKGAVGGGCRAVCHIDRRKQTNTENQLFGLASVGTCLPS